MKRALLGLGSVGALVAVIALGPALLRHDRVGYSFSAALAEGELLEPIGIAYRGGLLYVSDAGHGRIAVMDTTGALIDSWGGPGLELVRPMHITWGRDGALLVPEYLEDRVTRLDRNGALLSRTGGKTGSAPGEMDAPGGVAEIGGTLYVADFYNHRVDALGGSAPYTLGRAGRIPSGGLHYPTDIAAAGDSLLYVADAYNNRIQLFRPDGTFVRKWGGPLGMGGRGSLRGWFKVATGIEVARDTVYVADFDNNRLQIFTARGGYLGQVTDSLLRPTDMVKGGRGELYVVDFGHDRIVRFERR